MNTPTIVHPCDAWARSAGHADWKAALADLKAGAVLTGNAPAGEKSWIGLKMLMDQVEAEGLHVHANETGRFLIGRKECFSQDILDAQDRELERFARRMTPRG